MNLTGQQVYQKGVKTPRRTGAKAPTAAHRRRWEWLRQLGCAIGWGCSGRITIHHCGTGAGGRKDHDNTIGLCWGHHLGPEGIDGKRMSKREWQARYGLETELLRQTNEKLNQFLKEKDHAK